MSPTQHVGLIIYISIMNMGYVWLHRTMWQDTNGAENGVYRQKPSRRNYAVNVRGNGLRLMALTDIE